VKILATSDWHGDHITQGVRRFDELQTAVREIVDIAIEEEVDAFIFGGDLCDPDSGSCVFRVVRMALEAANRLNDARIPNYWLVGNHDVIEDGSGDTTLDPLLALQCEGLDTKVIRDPELFSHSMIRKSHEYAFLALPFTPTTRNYDAAKWVTEKLAPNKTGEHRVSFGKGIIVLGHLSVPGVQPGEETTEMPRGRDVEFPIQALADSGRPIACVIHGHYHRQQTLELPHIGKCFIPGSLAQLTFSEEGKQSGFGIIELP
jgi:DNA repair exonuclease SbcCD nuclease subunit